MRDMSIAASRPKTISRKLTCNYVDPRSGSCCEAGRLENTGYCAGHQGDMPSGMFSSYGTFTPVYLPLPVVSTIKGTKGRGRRRFEI